MREASSCISDSCDRVAVCIKLKRNVRRTSNEDLSVPVALSLEAPPRRLASGAGTKVHKA